MAYKSQYYDSQKAHEYYMKHRKLKRKRSKLSTAGMSKKGKSIASAVKQNITSRRKTETEKYRANVKTQKEQLKQQTTDKLNSIRKRLQEINANSSLSNNQKAELRGQLKEELMSIKDNYSKTIQNINEKTKQDIKSIKTSYDKTYESEFKKIKADKSLRQRKKRKRKRRR